MKAKTTRVSRLIRVARRFAMCRPTPLAVALLALYLAVVVLSSTASAAPSTGACCPTAASSVSSRSAEVYPLHR